MYICLCFTACIPSVLIIFQLLRLMWEQSGYVGTNHCPTTLFCLYPHSYQGLFVFLMEQTCPPCAELVQLEPSLFSLDLEEILKIRISEVFLDIPSKNTGLFLSLKNV